MKVPKLAFVVLCVLSLTALAYNFHFHNIPSEMYMDAWKWDDWYCPSDYTDFTNDTDFQQHVFKYVNVSANLEEPVKISTNNIGRDWFQEVYDSSWGHEIDIKYGDDFYRIQAWSQKAYYPSSSEHAILWLINLSTLALWGYVVFTLSEEWKVSKFKLALIVLLIATIVWGIAFYHTVQEYRKYREWLESDELWEIIEKYSLREPWWMWNGMRYICVTGMFLLLAWVSFIWVALEKLSKRLSERKKPAVNPLGASHRLPPSEGQKENKRIEGAEKK